MQEGIFTFVGYNWEQGKASFYYKISHNDEEFEFTESLVFPSQFEDIPAGLLKKMLDSLLLVLGISYYKLFCPKDLVLENISLSKDQAEFWNTLYTKGLGEFFYKNKVDFRGLINFPYSNIKQLSVAFPRQNRFLVGIGGGKDSIVVGELLKKFNKPFSAFVVNSNQIMEQAITLLGVDSVMVKREIDPLLFELNKRPDTYNGHVPVSAQNAFIGLFAALLFDYKYIVMANEQSANYGSTIYLDQEINHQWSKSYEFEQLFQSYVKAHITPDVNYFSLLRPFSEISIVERFVKYPKYFSSFSSCNRNFRINNKPDKKWCGECPKCAFTFAMLSAFVSKKELLNIFGQNLFEQVDLLKVYKELLGVSERKPFDCVGTPEEVQVAFYLAMKNNEYEKDPVMEFFEKNVLPTIKNIDRTKEEVFKFFEKHSIPEEFKEIIL